MHCVHGFMDALCVFSGWVNTLVGGQKEGAKGFMSFIINVDLTEEGLCKDLECFCVFWCWAVCF